MDEEGINMFLCEHEIEEDDIEKQSKTVKPKKKKDKASTSDCYMYFTMIGVGKDGKERVRYNSCNKYM